MGAQEFQHKPDSRISTASIQDAPGIFNYNRPVPNNAIVLPAGESSDVNGRAQIIDTFHLEPGCYSLLDIKWWGTYRSNIAPLEDDFMVRIFAGSAETPEDSPLLELPLGHAERTESPVNTPALNLRLYEYHTSLTAIERVSMTSARLWLSVVNKTANGDWGWIGYVSGGEACYRRGGDSGAWSHLFGSMAFSLGIKKTFH
jgi:hypothetical protein